MPRANRHFLPGLVGHLTHRCNQHEFPLKFARDLDTYVHWRFQRAHRDWVASALDKPAVEREAHWSKSIAVGSA